MNILAYLIGHTDHETKKVSLSYGKIEKDLGVSRATISSTLKKLADVGLFERLPDGTLLNHMVDGGSDTCGGFEMYFENLQSRLTKG